MSVFVSHGAPTLPLEDVPARDFLRSLPELVERPKAILCVSAHWDTTLPEVSTSERPETIHDFYGFPPALYALRYPAPGAPDVAARVVDVASAAGIEVRTAQRGLDHGAWVPLSLAYPEADIPVTQVSVQTAAGTASALALGRALAPLADEGVLILGSGGAIHNLREWSRGDERVPDWAREFQEWLDDRLEQGADDDLAHYRERAPHGARAHPTEEHYLPLLVALGAAGPGARGRALHRSFGPGGLSMAADAFSLAPSS